MTNPAPARPAKTYTTAYDFIPENGEAPEILPGLRWMRMPLPFDLNHVNIWLLETPQGFSIVDTGFNFEEGLDGWQRVFDTVIGGKKVEQLFITHFHPDHFGLAGWVVDRTGVKIQMTAPEYELARSLTDPAAQEMLESIYRPYYSAAGLTNDVMDAMLSRRFTYSKVIYPMPQAYSAVKPGDTVRLGGRDWLIIGGYGHSPQHASLYCAAEKIFIAGDMVLPDISPNISYFPDKFYSEDPLGVYLETLENIRRLVPDDTLVLPSHGVPFFGLHKRIEELKHHHQRRLEKLRKVLAAGPLTGHDAMVGLFSHRVISKASDIFFALGETLAHLVHDVKNGRLVKTTENGIDYYQLPE